ncbi:nitroreductase family protein [Inconstantimicrobium mannanitabidum]|uniref:Nitroreductase n=1 Tax=Inconstantimicrobium mannanitabidum TaxID=1604901 RepID=A0ACB5R6C5_9CLOT|nr:nitroreductase family protein [Clostridium sp. TW13]GKX64747.1 nitroreductase [Clostridium sp. TW13]
MALKTGRFYDCAEVKIDTDKCIVCGLCVKVCKGVPLFIEDNMVKVDQSRVFGCIACGQCMAVCPNNAIKINGRDMSPEDVIEMPKAEDRADYESLKSLMLSRRSVRDFKKQRVEREVIEKILDSASTCPNGLGSSDVEILVLDGNEKVQEFTADIIKALKKNMWLFSPIMLKIYRPFMRKASYDSLKTFAATALKAFVDNYDEGRDWLTHSAPLAMLFHVSPYADPADPYIPATYAMLAAQSLGLGTCMLGTPNLLLNYFGKKFKVKYGVPLKNKNGIMVVFGYPEIKYKSALKRRFADIKFY